MLSEKQKAELVLLPNGKPHISWSEARNWLECSWRHKLLYVLKLGEDEPSSILEFGTAVHATLEDWLPTKVMRPEVGIAALEVAFRNNVGKKTFEPETFELMKQQLLEIVSEVPAFFDQQWPGWEAVKAEHQIYEALSHSKPQHAFKGFIDAVIRVPTTMANGSTKWTTWIIDYKTTNSFWSADKKSDPLVTGQLMSYKHYWMQEMQVPESEMKSIKTAFLLLKRVGKPGKRCELVTVSVGSVTSGRTLNNLNNCVSSMTRGLAIKNKEACRWCPFKNTKHCP